MKNIGKLLKQAREMQAQMERLQETLAETKVEVSVGGGMVTLIGNGQHKVMSVSIEREVVNPDDVEMLEDLIVAAINDFHEKVEQLTREAMAQVAGDSVLPDGLLGGI